MNSSTQRPTSATQADVDRALWLPEHEPEARAFALASIRSGRPRLVQDHPSRARVNDNPRDTATPTPREEIIGGVAVGPHKPHTSKLSTRGAATTATQNDQP